MNPDPIEQTSPERQVYYPETIKNAKTILPLVLFALFIPLGFLVLAVKKFTSIRVGFISPGGPAKSGLCILSGL